MKDLLNQLVAVGVNVVIWGPHLDYGKARWQVILNKTASDGTVLEIKGCSIDLEAAAQEAYDKWNRTTVNLPELSLKQIEYERPPIDEGPGEQITPRDPDNEILF